LEKEYTKMNKQLRRFSVIVSLMALLIGSGIAGVAGQDAPQVEIDQAI
jgi:hypothetical protein